MDVLFFCHTLSNRHQCLDLAEIDQHIAGLATLLNNAGDDVTDLARELAELTFILGIAKPLHDQLAGNRCGKPTKIIRGVVEFFGELRLWTFVLSRRLKISQSLTGPYSDMTRLAIKLHARIMVRVWRFEIR